MRSGEFGVAAAQQRLQEIAGVSRVLLREQITQGAVFEIEASKGRLVRGDLARTIVNAGWELNELRPAAMSLEEIFLELTGSQAPVAEDTPAPAEPSAPEAEA
jgi:ABC-2 type transport system ATP-binding protein